MNPGMYTQTSIEWATPPELFKMLDDVHHFTLDVCANKKNHKCEKFFSPEQDGLAQSWAGHTCWMNPPYGRTIGKWIKKAVEESKHAKVVCLLPARTDTEYYHSYIQPNSVSTTFLKGRVGFIHPDKESVNRAPFPSMVVVFDARPESEPALPSSDGLATTD